MKIQKEIIKDEIRVARYKLGNISNNDVKKALRSYLRKLNLMLKGEEPS